MEGGFRVTRHILYLLNEEDCRRCGLGSRVKGRGGPECLNFQYSNKLIRLLSRNNQ